jgi:hypothetical protein
VFKTLNASRKAVVLILKMRVRDKQLKAQLVQHREREQTEYVRNLQSQFERVWVPAICHKVYAVFSREVRDLIYTELHAEHHRHPVDIFRLSPLDRELQLHSHPLDNLYLPPTPKAQRAPPIEDHPSSLGRDVYGRAYFNKKIVGAAIAQEVVEAWYKRATFAHSSMKTMFYPYYLRVDRWGLGLRPAHLLRHITLEIEEDKVREFRLSVHRSGGLRALRGIRGLRELHIKICSSCDLDNECLGCGRIKRFCKGNFENFLSRDEQFLWKMDNRFKGIASVLPEIAKADVRLLVTYEHNTQRYPPIELYKTGEALDPASWYDELEKYQKLRTPLYWLLHVGLTQHTGIGIPGGKSVRAFMYRDQLV